MSALTVQNAKQNFRVLINGFFLVLNVPSHGLVDLFECSPQISVKLLLVIISRVFMVEVMIVRERVTAEAYNPLCVKNHARVF